MTTPSSIQANHFAESLVALQSEYNRSAAHTPQTQDSLPPIPSDRADWEQFRKGPALLAYQQDMLNLTAQARQFLLIHAQPGKGRQRALDGLQVFEKSKIKAAGPHLKPITFGLIRTNLRHLCTLLKSDHIPIEERSSIAAEVFGSLGVCGEGEALNIQNAIEALQSRGQGLASKILQAKNQLIDQHLLALVQHESKGFSNAKVMEIHHVQGLKNAVADTWGLVAREDANIAAYFQDGVSPVAHALLAKTVTPQSIATLIANNLHETLRMNLPSPTGQWLPYSAKSIDTLATVLQAECGTSLNLHDIIETSEDFSQFKLKSPAAIQPAVISAMGELKLNLTSSVSEQRPTEPLQKTIESLSHLKNRQAFNQRHAGDNRFHPDKYAASLTFQLAPTPLTDDEKRKRKRLDTLT